MLSICKHLREGIIELEAAIESGEIPEHILHHFACDCAERALLREREAGREPDACSWEAIRIKRLWVEGKATEEKLDAACADARDAARNATWDSVRNRAMAAARWAARYAAWNATDAAWDAANATDAAKSAAWNAANATDAVWSAAWNAVWSAAWNAAFDKEQSWQTELLCALIERYQDARASLLSLLLERKKQIEIQQATAIPHWQEETSDALYL